MDDSRGNGTLTAPSTLNGGLKSSLNGHTSLNGHASLSGHALERRQRGEAHGPGWFVWSFSLVARLLTWYSIITILFRCPATLQACDETSPRICEPYFQLKHAVAPHVEPYYNVYAAPYVELARPYYNTLDERVITPSRVYANKYGAPRMQQAQAYSKAQWEKSIQPQLARCQATARAQYEQNLAPHLKGFSAATAPYYDIARTNALQTYYEVLQPSYEFVQPYAQQGYMVASTYATEAVVPSTLWAWNKTYVFLDGTVWPQLRVIYVEIVEPQLVKIGQRLGRYNGKKTAQKSVVEPPTGSAGRTVSSFTKPTPSMSSTAVASGSDMPASSTSRGGASEQDQMGTEMPRSSVAPPDMEGNEPEDEILRIARETVAEDLRDWQERYAKAADEGAAAIEERVEEITEQMIKQNAKTVGKALVGQLQDTVVSEMLNLRRSIVDVVDAVTKDSMTLLDGQERVNATVRQAGMAIKEKAVDVRTWRESYEAEMHTAITKAAESHFKILDGIQDLALQKIGMKWAWMEGITYKDWAKYHLLKSRFEEWHGDLQKLIVTHPGLEAAQLVGADVEDEAMQIAAAAAKELARLKQVAAWKLTAGDATEEFDSDATRLAAEAAESARAAANTATEPVDGEEDSADDGVHESPVESDLEAASEASASPTAASSEDTSRFAEENPTPAAGSLTPESSLVSDAAAEPDHLDEASESTPTPSDAPIVEETPSEATEEAGAGLPNLGETIILAEASAEHDGPAPVELPVTQLDEPEITIPADSNPESSSTSSVKPALFGVAAQSVPSRKPVLDDDSWDEVESMVQNMPASLTSAAQAAFSNAMSRASHHYSDALSAYSAEIAGTPKPVHEQMLASVTSAYSNAVASASSRLGDALSFAQKPFSATPTSNNDILPTSMPSVDWSHIEAIAGERLDQGRAWAAEQYESARIAIGLATPAPSTPAEHMNKLLENAKHNYFAGLGVAHARYSEFTAAASSALSSVTATPTPTNLAGTVSSAASVASESAASAVSAAGEKGSSAVSVVAENASAAAGTVVENWDALVSQLSVQVYGAPTPTPWYENLYHGASDYAASATEVARGAATSVTSAAVMASEEAAKQYAAVSSLMSELVMGKEPSFSESVYSRLDAAYSTMASFASDAQATASSAMSDATEAIKETVQHVKDEL